MAYFCYSGRSYGNPLDKPRIAGFLSIYMNNIFNIYDGLKNNNSELDERVHILFDYLEVEHFQDLTEGRYTSLFIMKLIKSMLIDDSVPKILEEIKHLENTDAQHGYMKPATQFQRGKIKGLWHKHYLPTGLGAMRKNLIQQVEFKEKEKYISKDIIKITNNKNLTIQEKASELANIVVFKQLSERFREKRVTGEWIIYHLYNNKKYYLDIANHEDDKEELAKNIRKAVMVEFPEFKGTLPLFN